jgi:hypothetical protein
MRGQRYRIADSGGSSRDARANHRGPQRPGHVADIGLSLTFFFIAAASNERLVQLVAMKLSNQSEVPVYTISGSNTARPLPEWLARRRKRSLKDDPEYANRVELLQDFEFEEASQCVRVSEDGEWVMSTGMEECFFCYRARLT